MRDGGDLDLGLGFHQAHLDAVACRFGVGEVFRVDGIDRGIIGEVRDEDMVEDDILEPGTGFGQDAADRLEDMAGLRCRIARMDDVVVFIEGQDPRRLDDVVRHHARRERTKRSGGACGDQNTIVHAVSSFWARAT